MSFMIPRARALCRAALLVTLFGAPAAAETLTLDDALARAAQGSPVLTAAKARADAARGLLTQAGALPNPEANFNAENVAGSGPYKGFDLTETTIGLSQRLELGGKRAARRAVAQAELSAAGLKLAVARADLARDVRLRFAEAMAARDRAAVAQEAAERASTLARTVETLVKEGREAPLRAARARTEAVTSRARAQAAAAEQAAALRALTGLWGQAPSADLALTGTDMPSAAAPALDPTLALDVVLADAETGAAQAAIVRERALAAPDLTVQAGLRHFSDSGDRALVIGASAPIPLFNRNEGGVAAARAELVGAEARRLQALAAAIRAQADARAAFDAAEARWQAASQSAEPLAREALDLARQGYGAGKFGLIDLLDAQAALAAAETDIIEARLDRARADAALRRVLARAED